MVFETEPILCENIAPPGYLDDKLVKLQSTTESIEFTDTAPPVLFDNVFKNVQLYSDPIWPE